LVVLGPARCPDGKPLAAIFVISSRLNLASRPTLTRLSRPWEAHFLIAAMLHPSIRAVSFADINSVMKTSPFVLVRHL
jgi:hypothetical protein